MLQQSVCNRRLLFAHPCLKPIHPDVHSLENTKDSGKYFDIILDDILITVDSNAVRHVLAAIPVASINGMESVWHECLAPNMERTDLTDGRTDKMVGEGNRREERCVADMHQRRGLLCASSQQSSNVA